MAEPAADLAVLGLFAGKRHLAGGKSAVAIGKPTIYRNSMEIIGTCIDCWPASASLTVNAFCAVAMLGLAVYRSA